jgi:acetyltransferase-like isoleucine patch superfamily enzyme
MNKAYRILRYDWPLHFVLLFTNWLPDNVMFLRLRGFLASFFFKQCGQNLRLGRNICFCNPANTKIGDDVYIAFGCWFLGIEEISIESEVMFGPYCVLSDGNHTFAKVSYRFGPHNKGKIVVKSGSWIGAHTVILMNVVIGNGVLVAANSVVNKDVNDFQIVGGVPSKELNAKLK